MDNDPKPTDRRPARAGTTETSMAESDLAESESAETDLAEMGLADTVLADTVLADTVLADTVLADTVLLETIRSETSATGASPAHAAPPDPSPRDADLPDLSLAELVCARLCHDLSSLLGSLTGTLELVLEAGPPTEELSVAADSAVALTLRLRLLRAAWAGTSEPLDLPELTALARGLPANRVGLDISHLPPATVFPPAMARLVLNLLLLAAASLPQGGTLYLDGAADDVIARIAGPRAAWPAGLIDMLANPAVARRALGEPRTLQAPLTALLARHHGLRLTAMLATGPAPHAPPLRLSIA